MSVLRLSVAFIVAPAVPVVLYCLPGLFAGESISKLLPFIYFGSVVAYAHAILLGVPAAAILARLRRLTPGRVLAAAFLIGALPFTGWTIYNEITMPPGAGFTFNSEVLRVDGQLTTAGWISILQGIGVCGLLGLAAGLAWWWISGAYAPRRTGNLAS